jgi:hypothetical protein
MFAAEVAPSRVVDRIHAAQYGETRPPSVRTIQRWRTERRWQARGSPG